MKKDGNAHDKSQKRKAAELIYEGLAETKEEYKLEATSLHDTMKNSSRTKHRWTWARIAVAAATVILVPTAVYAIGGWLGFFEGAWGNKGKENSTAHYDTMVVEDGVEKTYLNPAREYVEPDTEYAEQKIAPAVQELPLTIDLQGTTLSINAVVRDELGNAVVEYTLERDGGILPGLNQVQNGGKTKYGSIDNYTKDYSLRFACGLKEGCLEYSYKDESRSSDDKWYCYSYIIYDEATFLEHAKQTADAIQGWLKESTDEYYDYWRKDFESMNKKPFTREDYAEWKKTLEKDLVYWENPPMEDQGLIIDYTLYQNMEDRDKDNGNFKSEDHILTIPLKNQSIEAISFTSGDGLFSSEISPISMRFNDTSDSASVSILYRDGSEYIVSDRETLNYYNSFMHDANHIFMFNRLVKVEEIEKIVVNGKELYPVK